MENVWRAVLWTFALTLSLGCAAVWSGSADERPPSSPSTFVACGAGTPCEPGYWVFRAPDCPYQDLSHAPGSVVLPAGQAALQCRCRLIWLQTKADTPPRAKVSCAWVDLEEAREDD